jgi:outer membrane protein OmpA-like peptidoglycan-associated protein
MPRRLLIALVCTLAPPVAAAELAWPADATRVVTQTSDVAGFRMATGGHDGTTIPTRGHDGTLIQEIWRLPGAEGEPARVVAALRAQLIAQGYQIGFSCADVACGGFDFRFGLPIAPGPEMFVDLADFHYLTARRRAPTGADDLAITISRGGQSGYVHLARVTSGRAMPAPVWRADPTPEAAAPAPQAGLIDQLVATGRAVLEDLSFRPGASALSGEGYESLAILAAWLAQDRGRRVALVGHTDASGSQDANAALSLARAESVRRALVSDHGTAIDQVSAAGVGFLAPRATNSTPAGREANRRVEVVLVSN